MIEIPDIDLFSLAPGLLALLLSLYNYWVMRKPAHIIPDEIITYALISSEYEESYKFCFPMVFHNTGAKKGVIKGIKVGFKKEGQVRYVDVVGRARLLDVEEDEAERGDWQSFTRNGYRIILPTFPLPIEGGSSVDLILVATASFEDGILPLDQECEYVVEVRFGNNKINQASYPFFLAKSIIPDDRIIWIEPKQEVESD